MTDHGDWRRTQLVIGFAEDAAQGGRGADHLEVVTGRLVPGGKLRVAVDDDVEAAHRRARGQVGQRGVRGAKLLEDGERECGPDVSRRG
jgi:hypothetical protein